MTESHRPMLGRVACPAEHESTSGVFYFWVDRSQSVERTQIVVTESTVGPRQVSFVGIVQEVYRRSRQKDIGEESARFDGRSGESPPFESEGVTFAEVAILRTDPVAHTPPTEESAVYLATAAEAAKGYGVDRMENPLDVGLLKNGGTDFAGRSTLDLDYLLGENGGHMNVNGIAGLGAKSSFLLHVLWMLLREAERQKRAHPSDRNRLQIAPIVFNVKNYDLFFIDRWNKKYLEKQADHIGDWKKLGVEDPAPFREVKFLSPQLKGQTNAADVGRGEGSLTPYSWSLSDVIEQGLFKFLFADDAVYEPNFGGLVDELAEWLTDESSGTPKLSSAADVPQTFHDLLKEFKSLPPIDTRDYAKSTQGKVYRHLKFILRQGGGVLRQTDRRGSPIVLANAERAGPTVIDLFSLRLTPGLQRFVVAAVFHQLVRLRSEDPTPGLRFVVMLDELNRFAPRNSSDPITQIIETVAAEMRSQGVILLGAQQQASFVAQRVIANCAIRALGRSDSLELGSEVWKSLAKSARDTAAQLQADEKLLMQPNFREPMLAKIPFPPFCLKKEHASVPAGQPSTQRVWESIAEADFA